MTSALTAVRATLAVDLRTIAASAIPGGFDVFTGRAPVSADQSVKPYAVLFPADGEFEATEGRDKMRASAPSAVLATANVYGTTRTAPTIAGAVADRWLAHPSPFADALVTRGRRLIYAENAGTTALPAPQDADSGDLAGFRVAVRLTTQPTS